MAYFVWGLTLLFIGFKLSNIITWSWWFVLCPVPLYVIIYAVCYMLCELYQFQKDPIAYQRRENLRKLMRREF